MGLTPPGKWMALCPEKGPFQKGKKQRLASLAFFRGELFVCPGEQVDDENLLTPIKTGFGYRQLNQTCTIFLPWQKGSRKVPTKSAAPPFGYAVWNLDPLSGIPKKKKGRHTTPTLRSWGGLGSCGVSEPIVPQELQKPEFFPPKFPLAHQTLRKNLSTFSGL